MKLNDKQVIKQLLDNVLDVYIETDQLNDINDKKDLEILLGQDFDSDLIDNETVQEYIDNNIERIIA